jgi:hypothetical protein
MIILQLAWPCSEMLLSLGKEEGNVGMGEETTNTSVHGTGLGNRTHFSR